MSNRVILLLEEHLEKIRRSELDRLFRRLQLDVAGRTAVDTLSRNIVEKVMERPVSVLTAGPEGLDTENLAGSASRLFNLDRDETAAV